MARDCSLDVRRAVVTTLAEDVDMQAILGAADAASAEVYGPQAKSDPVWPFVRCDAPPAFPDFDGCSAEASRYRFNVHGFAKGPDEVAASELGKLIARKIDGLTIQIAAAPDAWLRDILWTGTQVLGDTDEANGWHAVVGFEALVSAEAV